MSKKEDGWAYANNLRSETYEGPFPTREEAIREGLASFADNDSIVVAKAVYPDPIREIASRFSMEIVLAHLEEIAMDGEWWCGDGDALFAVKGSPGAASRALAVALGVWAHEYIEPQYFTAQDPETVMRNQIED